jgi:hypothetical protein
MVCHLSCQDISKGYFLDHSYYTLAKYYGKRGRPTNLDINCILSLPGIQSLHLSGNGLGGKLSLENRKLNENFTDLILSHNQFEGTIPEEIYSHGKWLTLDLSFNRFQGTLSTSSVFLSQEESSTTSTTYSNNMTSESSTALIL